jgi:hypothetical protein
MIKEELINKSFIKTKSNKTLEKEKGIIRV